MTSRSTCLLKRRIQISALTCVIWRINTRRTTFCFVWLPHGDLATDEDLRLFLNIEEMNLTMNNSVTGSSRYESEVETDGTFDTPIDKTLEELTFTVIACGLENILSLFGIFGNSVNLMVLYRHGFKESTNIFLFSLSVCDLIYCCLRPIQSLDRCILSRIDVNFSLTFGAYASVYIYTFIICFTYCSSTHVMVIAIERLVAVFFPFKVSHIFTPNTVKIIIVIIYIYVIFPLSVTAFLLITVEWETNVTTNVTFTKFALTEFYQNNFEIMTLVFTTIVTNLYFTTSVVVVVISSAAISIRLSVTRQNMAGKMASANSRADKRANKILFVVCIFYAATSLPSVAIEMYALAVPNLRFNPLIEYLSYFTGLLYTFNATANFIIYVTLSPKFAKTYKKILCPNNKKGSNQISKLKKDNP